MKLTGLGLATRFTVVVLLLCLAIKSQGATASITPQHEEHLVTHTVMGYGSTLCDRLQATANYTWTGSNYLAVVSVTCNATFHWTGHPDRNESWSVPCGFTDLTTDGGGGSFDFYYAVQEIWNHHHTGEEHVSYHYSYYVIVKHKILGGDYAHDLEIGDLDLYF